MDRPRRGATVTEMIQKHDGRRDIAQAVAELGERLPEPLLPLASLAYNYRWSWMSGAAALFRDIDPQIWRHSGCNARAVIATAATRRFAELAGQQEFIERLHSVHACIEADLTRPWAQTPIAPERPVAYVCSEFGIHCSLPLYGGGLGILAGDLLKAASDFALPMVGVGLLYHQGYFRQRMDTEGWQHEYWTTINCDQLPMVRVTGPDEQPLTVDVVMRERPVHIQALAAKGVRSILNYGPGEENLAHESEAASEGAAMTMKTSIAELIALTRRAKLFIGGDTGPMHLAAALQIPVVAIFGTTDPARNGPYRTRSIVLRNPASPTTHARRAQPDEGMLEIGFDAVAGAACRLLNESSGP